jgi:hypothetical protein
VPASYRTTARDASVRRLSFRVGASPLAYAGGLACLGIAVWMWFRGAALLRSPEWSGRALMLGLGAMVLMVPALVAAMALARAVVEVDPREGVIRVTRSWTPNRREESERSQSFPLASAVAVHAAHVQTAKEAWWRLDLEHGDGTRSVLLGYLPTRRSARDKAAQITAAIEATRRG